MGSVDSSTVTSDLLQKCATSLPKSPFDDVCLRQSIEFCFFNEISSFASTSHLRNTGFSPIGSPKSVSTEKKNINIYTKTKNPTFQVSVVKQIRTRHFPLWRRK